MGHVVEQRPDGEPGPERRPDGATPGSEVEPARQAAPEQRAEPERFDAEQFRQFQQFQQFQEFLRYQEAQQGGSTPRYPPAAAPPQQLDPAPPGRPKAPRWLRWLGKKVLGWLVFLALLALALILAAKYIINMVTGGDDPERPAAEMGGGTYRTNKILSTEPYEAVRKVYAQIAYGRPDLACGYFDNERGIQQRFAVNTGYADCREAVLGLHEQVAHVNDYAESIYPRTYDPDATTIRIDSCDFPIEGGPALGTFVVTKQDFEGQWLITGHEKGPRTCPAPPASTGPTR
ncbi:hypothetical protein B0I33_11375 [Prauserella shujinwangii]|uniref:Uncharacterized protein n=1 Tax=Prauserella shujinwangii TaxID=1453103 RepID=A0A2T0LLJ5_9PSEU|nr:hypothetical protein [Prauserella shujinwangii]PRX43909.1 hypothetical protein B0I33_11375 [Prauserella shujinwangii]